MEIKELGKEDYLLAINLVELFAEVWPEYGYQRADELVARKLLNRPLFDMVVAMEGKAMLLFMWRLTSPTRRL